MRTVKAFTLVEMLAVIGIMLILMTVTFGIFNLFAERTGPESVMATIQAVLNGARDYAASNGVYTQVEFRVLDSDNEIMDSTVLTFRYWEDRTASDPDWVLVRGRRPLRVGGHLYVIKELPSGLSSINAPASTADPLNPQDSDINRWRTYQESLRDVVRGHVISSSKPKDDTFYIEFDPAGYPRRASRDPKVSSNELVQSAFTIAKIVGDQVEEFAFYPLNLNSGTRLVFE